MFKAFSKNWFIYTLGDGETGEIRYVGVAINPPERLTRHIRDAKKNMYDTHKDRWIRSQLERGLVPVLNVIDSGFGSKWAEREIFWIAKLKSEGKSLTNGTIGGEGWFGNKHSDKSKKLMSLAMTGKSHVVSMEQRRAQSLAMKGRKRTEEHKRALSLALKGRIPSDETRMKTSRTMLGRKQSEDHKRLVQEYKESRSTAVPSDVLGFYNAYHELRISGSMRGKLDDLLEQWRISRTMYKRIVAGKHWVIRKARGGKWPV